MESNNSPYKEEHNLAIDVQKQLEITTSIQRFPNKHSIQSKTREVIPLYLRTTSSSASLAIVLLDKLLLGDCLPLPSNAVLVGDAPLDSLLMCDVGGELGLPEGDAIECLLVLEAAATGAFSVRGPRAMRGPRGCCCPAGVREIEALSAASLIGEGVRETLSDPALSAGDWSPDLGLSRFSCASGTEGLPVGGEASAPPSAVGSTILGKGGGESASGGGSLKSGRGGP